MFYKFLNVRSKLATFFCHGRPRPVAQIQQGPRESHGASSALKIVHPGGVVECYYMAIPAVTIMKKYPSFVLARPEVFRRPWDSLVRSHAILSPGEKFYLVPRRTVRKLRQRIEKPNGEASVSQSFIEVSKDGLSSKPNEVGDSSGVRSSFTTNITTSLTSTSNSTIQSDNIMVRTGEDLLAANQTALATLINVADAAAETNDTSTDETGSSGCEFDPKEPLDCRDPEVFQSMMQKAIERFKDIHFNRFGKPTPGPEGNTCDMAWRFRPGYEPASGMQDQGGFSLPAAGEIVNDSLPVVESEQEFIRQRYLIYVGGGDRCKSMKHYLWSFLCALGEARYLKRTLVMDMTLCLSSIYTSSNLDEEGKDFRFYFDFEHLVEDFRVSPKQLSKVKHSLIMRKFGFVEPDNYWYRVCEGTTKSVVQRPWHLIRKSRRLMDLVAAIGSKLNWDYDSVHIVRGEKARNRDLWPSLAQDTSPDALLSTLQNKIEDGRSVYIATNEPETSFFEPLKHKYVTHFLNDYKEFWGDRSEWYSDTAKLNNGAPVEFDGYMRASVDAELFLRGKKQFETFNDLTNDCKDGVNTCGTGSFFHQFYVEN